MSLPVACKWKKASFQAILVSRAFELGAICTRFYIVSRRKISERIPSRNSGVIQVPWRRSIHESLGYRPFSSLPSIHSFDRVNRQRFTFRSGRSPRPRTVDRDTKFTM